MIMPINASKGSYYVLLSREELELLDKALTHHLVDAGMEEAPSEGDGTLEGFDLEALRNDLRMVLAGVL